DAPLVRMLKRGYAALLSRIISRPRQAYVAAALTMIAGLAVVPFLGQSLIPEFKERDFLGHWITKPGTSLPEERRIVTRASREIRSIPGVGHFGTHIGQAFLADEIAGVNFGENWIAMDKSADYSKTRGAIEETVKGYPGMFHDVQTYLNERIDEVLAGSSEPIVVRIFGPDLDTLHSKADEVRDKLAAIRGVSDAAVEFPEGTPQLEVQVERGAAPRYGVKPGDVRRAASTLVESEEVGDIFRGGRAYDVHVWSTPNTRNSVASILQLPIDTPGGGTVPLETIAKAKITPLPNVIHHEGTSRVIDVLVGVEGRALGSVVSDIDDRLESITFPLGYHAVVLGEYKERQDAQRR